MMRKGSEVYQWVQSLVAIRVITENLLSEVSDALRNSECQSLKACCHQFPISCIHGSLTRKGGALFFYSCVLIPRRVPQLLWNSTDIYWVSKWMRREASDWVQRCEFWGVMNRGIPLEKSCVQRYSVSTALELSHVFLWNGIGVQWLSIAFFRPTSFGEDRRPGVTGGIRGTG